MSRIAVIEGETKSLSRFRGHLLCAIRDAGHDVHTIAPPEPTTQDWIAQQRMTFHEAPLARASVSPTGDLRFARFLRGKLKQLRPDLVLTCTIKPTVYGIPIAAAAGIKRRYALITGLGYAFTTGGSAGRRSALRAAASALYGVSLRLATAVAFQNADDREEFRRRRLLGRTPSHVVNGSGVDLDYFAPAPLPPQPHFLMIARLLRDKGLGEYLAAARIVKAARPNARFDLVGAVDPNPSSFPIDELRSAIADGIVAYLGWLPDVRPAIAAARFYVLPSYREGMPRSVLEAMAMGRPIITTDAPGCRSTVIPGETGLLVPPGDAKALADAMIVLIDHDAAAEQMATRSRALAEERFDQRQVTQDLLRIMELQS